MFFFTNRSSSIVFCVCFAWRWSFRCWCIKPRPLQVWNLDAWNLEPLNLGTLEPQNPGNLQLWNLGTQWNPGTLQSIGTVPDKSVEPCNLRTLDTSVTSGDRINYIQFGCVWKWVVYCIPSVSGDLGREALLMNHQISGDKLFSDKATWPPSACSREFPQHWMVIRVWCAFFLSFFYFCSY